jgi:hypothetical protein
VSELVRVKRECFTSLPFNGLLGVVVVVVVVVSDGDIVRKGKGSFSLSSIYKNNVYFTLTPHYNRTAGPVNPVPGAGIANPAEAAAALDSLSIEAGTRALFFGGAPNSPLTATTSSPLSTIIPRVLLNSFGILFFLFFGRRNSSQSHKTKLKCLS